MTSERVLASFAIVLGLAGCTPVYVPAALNAPLSDHKGDIHLAAMGGTQGGQANMAYALTDHVQLRGSAHATQGTAKDSNGADVDAYFREIDAGAGVYLALSNPTSGSGLRWSGALDLGGGTTRGSSEVPAPTGEETLLYSGAFGKAAVQTVFAYEFEKFALGGGGRVAYMYLRHDKVTESPDDSSNWVTAEPVVLFRVGSPRIKVDTQVGWAFPLVGEEDIGVAVPLIVSVGVTADF